ncbi:MAG: protein phosphatase 2C domain-containing protein [Melioribacteraceae bacterium]|nr:protein phosphatase 2C domain-containing protein [Melioribacteraceae bacterium]
MQILFDYSVNYLSDSNHQTKLPFSIFGMTQQGLSHKGQNIGNQDAACIFVGQNAIIGAIADGCTSGKNLNGKSSNQVGANIISYLAVSIARKLLMKNHISFDNFMSPFQQYLIDHLKKSLNALHPWKQEKNEVISNYFSATIITIVITKKKYLILYSGDGNVFINGEKKELKHQSGKYFTNNLFDLKYTKSGYIINPDYQIRCLQKGNSNHLNSILISTDGFIDDDVVAAENFPNFFFNPNGIINKNGFIDRRKDFRINLLEEITTSKNGRMWPADDATFISLNRINKSSL